MISPGFTFTDALAGLSFTSTRPASQASFATVRRLINLDTFKKFCLISSICSPVYFTVSRFFRTHNAKKAEEYQDTLRHKSFRINITNSDYSLIASFNALPALNFGALQAAIFIVSPV